MASAGCTAVDAVVEQGVWLLTAIKGGVLAQGDEVSGREGRPFRGGRRRHRALLVSGYCGDRRHG